MNFIGINETIPLCGEESEEGSLCPVPSDDLLNSLIKSVHDKGGLVIVNHLPWSLEEEPGTKQPRLPDHPTLEKLFEWGVDGIETIHRRTFDLPSYHFAVKHNMINIAGSDIHVPQPTYAWNILQVPDNQKISKESIMNELRNRRNTFIMDPTGRNFPKGYYDTNEHVHKAYDYESTRVLFDLPNFLKKEFTDFSQG